MVHNGAPNVGTYFCDYFYNYKSIVKFEWSLMFFIVGRAFSTIWSFFLL
jgi:hypothetical protein